MDATASGALTDRSEKLRMQRYCPENVAHNAKQLYYIRSIVTSVAGSTAGVLGLVNLDGFYFYLVCVLATNAAIYAFCLHFRPSAYLMQKSPYTFFADGLQEMAFGYVLWWTLWTALVHVYD